MPIVAPSVRLLTAAGPYADLITYGQTQVSDDLPIVSIVGGFAWSDTPENGLAILTYGRTAAIAEGLAQDIAQRAWTDRSRYQVSLTPLDEVVAMAKARWGGYSGPSALLRRCRGQSRRRWAREHNGSAERPVSGESRSRVTRPVRRCSRSRNMPRSRCWRRDIADAEQGVHRADATECAVAAKVLALSDGYIVGRRGIMAGRTINLGKAAAIQVGGLAIVLASRRIQAADPLSSRLSAWNQGPSRQFS